MKVIAILVGLISACLLGWATYLSRIDRNEVAKVAAAEANDKLVKMVSSKIGNEALTLEPPQTLYGYYGDFDHAGKITTISKETYSLRFAKASPVVIGEISGPVKVENKIIQRKWAIRGVRRDSLMALTMLGVPTADDPTAKGIGTYYLSKNGDDYTGTAVYLDCVHRVVQCPYAIAGKDLNEDEARARWPEVFKRQCEKIDLTPGLELATSC